MAYVYSALGADDPCAPCYQQKSEAYAACQQLPAGSAAREDCFRKADVAVASCLRGCGGSPQASAKLPLLLTAALIAGAVWS